MIIKIHQDKDTVIQIIYPRSKYFYNSRKNIQILFKEKSIVVYPCEWK